MSAPTRGPKPTPRPFEPGMVLESIRRRAENILALDLAFLRRPSILPAFLLHCLLF
ncbi:hypothetical protein GQ44DRAFT_719509 [Phaeosphaeriaceae sp. PMI808]|nr:hypothetical protein GQ44DRAFT_719509 [Phaeosphaeriaceae sp. PMI808]